jgi:hypothetical protein
VAKLHGRLARAAPPQAPLPPRPRPEAPGRDFAPATPRQAVPSSVEVSAAAIERLRASLPRADRPKPEPAVVAEGNEVPLSPNDPAVPVQQEHPAAVETAPQSKVTPQPMARVESASEPSGPGAGAIVKSGVVDGMAYTLYADGSIEAKLPHGVVRCGSLAELRVHIESNL